MTVTATTPTLMLTVDEAARELRIGRHKTYELITSGALKSVKIGQARRVRRTDLEAYVASLAEEVAV